MKMFRIIFIILGLVAEVLYTPPLIMHKIVNIGNAPGIIVGVILIFYGIFAVRINAIFKIMWRIKLVRMLLVLLTFALSIGVITVGIISGLIIRASSNLPNGDETLIVLGCQVKGTKPSLMLNERINAAKDYLNEHEDAVCILSGGQGPDEGISEAKCMYNRLVEEKIAPDRLIVEDQSTSTRENLKYSFDIIRERNLNHNIAIVTNEFHEYRASVIADKLGLSSTAVPARTHWWMFPTYFTREWFGVVYEWMGMEH